jgi:hypothetical protein
MKNLISLICILGLFTEISYTGKHIAGSATVDTILVSDTIQYHPVRVNKADGSILPWFSLDPGSSYDTVLMLVWDRSMICVDWEVIR